MAHFRVYRQGAKWMADFRSAGFGRRNLDTPADADAVEAVHAGYAVLEELRREEAQRQEKAAAEARDKVLSDMPSWDAVTKTFSETLQRFHVDPTRAFEEVTIPADLWREEGQEEQLDWWYRDNKTELLAEALRCGTTFHTRELRAGHLHTLRCLRDAENDLDSSVAIWILAGLWTLHKQAPDQWHGKRYLLTAALGHCARARFPEYSGPHWRHNQEAYPYPVLAELLHDVVMEPQTCEDLVRVLAFEVVHLRRDWTLVAMRPSTQPGQDEQRRRLELVP